MRRRDVLLAIGLSLGVPLARGRDTATVFRVGFLSPVSPGARDKAFLRGLGELGYVDGRNVAVEMRFAEGRPERLPGLVQELLRLRIDVLVVGATIGARAAKEATTMVPIVFAGASDPVAGGIVASLARPGGNITGFSTAYGDHFAGKWLELLKEAAPDVSHVAALWSSSNAGCGAIRRSAPVGRGLHGRHARRAPCGKRWRTRRSIRRDRQPGGRKR